MFFFSPSRLVAAAMHRRRRRSSWSLPPSRLILVRSSFIVEAARANLVKFGGERRTSKQFEDSGRRVYHHRSSAAARVSLYRAASLTLHCLPLPHVLTPSWFLSVCTGTPLSCPLRGHRVGFREVVVVLLRFRPIHQPPRLRPFHLSLVSRLASP